MRSLRRVITSLVLFGLIAASNAVAQTTNYWTNTLGGAWSTAGNWNPNTVPATSSSHVFFTNNALAAYTVDFSGGNATSYQFLVRSDNVNFDLQGNRWDAFSLSSGTHPLVDRSHWIGADPGSTATVSFSSSVAPGVNGNTVNLGATLAGALLVSSNAGNLVTININTNLGYGVLVRMPQNFKFRNSLATNTIINIDGTGAVLLGPSVNTEELGGVINVSNGGLLEFAGGVVLANQIGYGHYTISNATLKTGGATGSTTIDNLSVTQFKLLDGSTWNANAIVAGFNSGDTFATIDDSTVYAHSLSLGNHSASIVDWTVQNGATMYLSNGQFTVNNVNPALASTQFTLDNGTVVLGGTITNVAYSGALTNRSIMRAGGTIRGGGAARTLVRNERLLEIGNSIGTLVLSNANLELAAGSSNLFEFSDTALDQILGDGYATVLGSNIFSLASGSALPEPGYKWGLGAYDFIVGSNVTWSPQYDNLTNLLAGYGLVQDLDYRYGVMNIGGGLQALRLEFVPEPSTVVLLLGGGLVLLRVRRRHASPQA